MKSTSSHPEKKRTNRSFYRPSRPRELREAGIAPTKALGQHFLTDTSVVKRILDAATPQDDEAIIEVGPGLGALTAGLAETGRPVITVEVDRGLAARLRDELSAMPTVHLMEADILTQSPAELLAAAGLAPETPYSVVANLPYNIGTAVVRRFLEAETPPRRLVVMLQREVAESMSAETGEMGILSVSVQIYAEVRRLFTVPKTAFYPPPKVTSTVIRIDLRAKPLVSAEERASFFEVVRAGFSAPRKQLHNSLAQGLRRPVPEVSAAIEAVGLAPTLRPQMLGVEDWLRLSRELRA